MSDRICVIQRGKIVAEAPPAQLVARHGGDASVTITAAGFGPSDALRAIVTEANAAGARITALDLHRPTLEDAFIAITGETLGEGEAE